MEVYFKVQLFWLMILQQLLENLVASQNQGNDGSLFILIFLSCRLDHLTMHEGLHSKLIKSIELLQAIFLDISDVSVQFFCHSQGVVLIINRQQCLISINQLRGGETTGGFLPSIIGPSGVQSEVGQSLMVLLKNVFNIFSKSLFMRWSYPFVGG